MCLSPWRIRVRAAACSPPRLTGWLWLVQDPQVLQKLLDTRGPRRCPGARQVMIDSGIEVEYLGGSAYPPPEVRGNREYLVLLAGVAKDNP